MNVLHAEADNINDLKDEICRLNNLCLILKYTKGNQSETYICHHGFKKQTQLRDYLDGAGKKSWERKKKTNCQFQIKFTKMGKSSIKLEVEPNHNHALNSHYETFQKINFETMQKLKLMFDQKISPAQAIKQFQKMVPLERQHDRTIFPRKCDVYNIFSKFRVEKYGPENGPDMFNKLNQRISDYDGIKYFSGNFQLVSDNIDCPDS